MSTAQGNPNVDLKTVLAWKPAPQKVSYTARDTILYNLGVGAKDLSYVYERDAGFRAVSAGRSVHQPGSHLLSCRDCSCRRCFVPCRSRCGGELVGVHVVVLMHMHTA